MLLHRNLLTKLPPGTNICLHCRRINILDRLLPLALIVNGYVRYMQNLFFLDFATKSETCIVDVFTRI